MSFHIFYPKMCLGCVLQVATFGAAAALPFTGSGSLSQVHADILKLDTWGVVSQQRRDADMPGYIDTAFQAEINHELASGMHKRIDESQWEEVFANITRLGAADPGHALVLSNGFGWEGGYASRVLAVLNEVALAMLFNKPLAFCNNTFTDRIWTKFYNVELPLYNDSVMNWGYKDRGIWNMHFTDRCGYKFKEIGKWQVCPALTATSFDYIAKLKQFAYSKTMQLKPEVQVKVDAALSSYGFPAEAKFIGVHVRHGDKAPEMESGLLPLETYADVLRQEIDRTGIRKVYVASDDPEAKDVLQRLLGASVELLQKYDPNSGARHYDDESMVMNFLVDMTALQRAEIFIGTQSSNMGRMAYYMRGRPVVSSTAEGVNRFLARPARSGVTEQTAPSTSALTSSHNQVDRKALSLDGDWSVIPKASSDCGRRR